MAEAAVIDIQQRIAQSRRASAVERAWNVAKALEGDRDQLRGLRWVEPERPDGKGITRTINFDEDFPEGRTYVQPVPLSLGVCAPASALVPGEDLDVAWTMPLLTRLSPAPNSLDSDVTRMLRLAGATSIRSTIDVVSFLPFPKAGAPEEEQFKPEFFISLGVGADLGEPSNYFGAVSQHGGKTVRQYVTMDAPKHVGVFADPKEHRYFDASMLVNMGADELAATPQDAGVINLFVYRIRQGYQISIGKTAYGAPSDFFGGGWESDFSPMRSAPTRMISALPRLPQTPTVSPSDAAKEVGDVSIGEGSSAGAVKTGSLDGYVTDTSFAVQPIRIKFLGVREGAEEAARAALEQTDARHVSYMP